MRLSVTGNALLIAFQRKILIFGAVLRDQIQSLIPFKDDNIPPATKASLLAFFSPNQYPDLTDYSPEWE